MNLAIKVQANAFKNEILDWGEGVLRVRIKSPPENGKANQALVSFLASVTGIPKSQIKIIKGFTSRKKVIYIQDKYKPLFPDIFLTGS